jgi:hypothetical protein
MLHDYFHCGLFLTLASALCFIEWGEEFAGTGGVLVAGTSDGKLGFIDVKDARLLQVGCSVCGRFCFYFRLCHGRSITCSRHASHASLCPTVAMPEKRVGVFPHLVVVFQYIQWLRLIRWAAVHGSAL